MFNPVGQVGLVNINLGESSAPAVEEEVLTEVASYGKQLGKVCDALVVLLNHMPADVVLTPKEGEAIASLRSLVSKVEAVKRAHGRG